MASSRALATRCTACGTVFRVVPDQLRVSEGWVRCGRCSEVFNAPQSLVDMDTGAHQRLRDADRQSLVGAHQRLPDADRQSLVATPAAATEAAQPLHFEPLLSGAELPAPAPAPEPEPELDFGAAPTGREPGVISLPDPRAEPDDRPPPSFVRLADRAARWRHPRVRLALSTGVVAAVLALTAQTVFTYRDLAAARWPVLRPALEIACSALRCELGAARAIAGLAVQSSGLSRVDNSELYRLAVTLRNRTDLELAVPAIDLSLTDAQGRLLSRRVLGLAELGQPAASLAAGRELVLQATLQVAAAAAGEPVAGYTIELFYP